MPLVVITGIPASGKSTRAAQIKEYLEKEHNKTVHIVSENEVITSTNLNKNALYLGNFLNLLFSRFMAKKNVLLSCLTLIDCSNFFADSSKEKEVRSIIKSEVQRYICTLYVNLIIID